MKWRMVPGQTVHYSTLEFPAAGAVRVHRAPTQLRPRESDSRPDRFDDPRNEYRVRYLATTLRGALLEVLDHFRPDADAEASLSSVTGVEGIDMLEEEPAGLMPEKWLSDQRVTIGTIGGHALFVDVANATTLAALYYESVVQHALRSLEVRRTFGEQVRLDLGTICAVGEVARLITQAVSQAVFMHPTRPPGIAYVTRFDHDERCWAVFDERVMIEFSPPVPLDHTDEKHNTAVCQVAALYRLVLPPRWH